MGKCVIIWGAGVYGRQILTRLPREGFEPIAFADNNPNLWDTELKGLKIYSPEELKAHFPATILVAIASQSYQVIRKQLRAMGFNNIAIYSLHFDKYWKGLIQGFLFEADALSYSLLGEDLIVNAIFQALGISIPVYAEIGVLEPIQNSNTYLFYERGGTGILVEADPRCEQKIRHFRGNDKYIAKAIGPQRCMLPIYRGSITTLSPTCSERWDYYKNQKSEPTEMVEVVTFDDIFLNENIQYVSLDIEELDEAVIKSIDFGKYPDLLVFCSETRLNQNVYLHMDHHDFARFAFTRDNEIYVRKSIIPVLLNNFDCKRIHDMCVFLNSKVLLA